MSFFHRLKAWLPSAPRGFKGWFLAITLTVTVLYLAVGVFFAWQIYIDSKVNRRSLYFYPFPAARVDTTIIPLARYLRDVDAIKRYVAESGTNQDYADLSVEKKVMERLIQAALYERIAHRYGISITPEEVESAYQASAGQETDPVEKVLAKYYNFTPKDFKVWIEEYLLQEKVRNEVPKKRMVKHILIAVEVNAKDDEVKQKQQKAQEIVDKLKAGSDFAELAKQESNDLATRDGGGSLGSVTRGTKDAPVIDHDFENAVFTAPLNQVVGPARDSRGWDIIVVTEESGKVDKNIEDIINDEKSHASISQYLKT